MYIKHINNKFVKATVYPFAEPDSDPRFVGSSPSFAVLPDGEILYNGKPTNMEGVVTEAAQKIAAIIEAEKIADYDLDRSTIKALAELLRKEVKK